MAVKANQPALLDDLVTLFADRELVAATGTTTQTIGCRHGRIEHRQLWASTALVGYSNWPGLAQALCVERTITTKRTGQRRQEQVYAVTSLPPERADASTLLRLWRAHWAIENQLHWVRDVTMGEDASQVRSGSAPQVLAALRNTVLGLLRTHGHQAIAATRRRLASHVEEALALVGVT